MSALFKVTSSTGEYTVEIASGLYHAMLSGDKNCVALCDERFTTDFESAGIKNIPLPAAESAKSLDAIPNIIIALRKLGVKRDTHLLAVGGGIVQDIAAFCAAIYMRGLNWTYVPTTLLGMVDSCIGGKSSINVGEYKNIVGTYNPPQRVMIDPALAATLSAEQVVAGLIEAAKICFCRGGDAWKNYTAAKPSLHMDEATVVKVTSTSLAAKKWFIETDEFDRGDRLLLNFGHTFGHALEGASHFNISHGIAVGVGILCALSYGRRSGMSYENMPPVKELEAHMRMLLAGAPNLSAHLHGVTAADMFDRFKADKKHTTATYRAVLVNSQGKTELLPVPNDAAGQKMLFSAIEEVLAELRNKKSQAA